MTGRSLPVRGLIGAVPALLLTGKPFGFTAILGLIGLAGILMRNTLILVDQIGAEQALGLDARDAVIEATVRRARPVLLTALAAVLAFLPLSLSSFWGPLAIVLIGGTIVGTALTLFFLPALYALVFGVRRSTPSIRSKAKPRNPSLDGSATVSATGSGSRRTSLALAALAAVFAITHAVSERSSQPRPPAWAGERWSCSASRRSAA